MSYTAAAYEGVPEGFKWCTNRDPEKRHLAPLSEFNRHKGKSDGLQAQCRNCHNPVNRENYHKRLVAETPEAVHGTAGGYSNHGCRCEQCREANNAYQSQWRTSKLPEMEADPLHPWHGSVLGYQAGCRCAPCRAATPGDFNQRAKASQEFQAVVEHLSGLCAYGVWFGLHEPREWEEVGHVIPRSRFAEVGLDSPEDLDVVENLAPICKECNRGPGGQFSKMLHEWLPERL